jgi:threonine/homoserine/homoserine lactone efflux protein
METSVENLVSSAVAGFVSGFVVSIPVGPVNLTVINHALRKGFVAAFLVGLGAIAAELIYAMLMLAGHSTILNHRTVVWTMRVAALVVMALLGLRNLLMKSEKVEAGAVKAAQVDERWHHPRSFLLGFVLTISNFVLALVWATLAALLFAHEWVQSSWASRSACLTGVLGGGALWFFLLAFFVSRAHRRVKPNVLTALVRGSGVVFLAFAALLAYRLFRR